MVNTGKYQVLKLEVRFRTFQKLLYSGTLHSESKNLDYWQTHPANELVQFTDYESKYSSNHSLFNWKLC
uniref:Uncharacterized protein n=1 Tax=Setaria italica TaxID=4555 RepID=K3XP14_SETIT